MRRGANPVTPRAPHFESGNVLVVGDVMLDRYWHGNVARISPEAPVPVVQIESHEHRPGGAANVAVNVAALGARTSLVGLVGQDEAAELLQGQLAAAGVRHALVATTGEPTIVKLRVMSRNQQIIRLDHELVFAHGYGALLEENVRGLLHAARVLVLSDYGKGTLADPQRLIAQGRSAGLQVLVDPKGLDFARYYGASLLKPNLAEFEAVVGPCGSDGELVAKGAELVQRLGLEALLVTRGKDGMTLIPRDGSATHFPARAKEVYDVTGAGDTAISTTAAALACGFGLVEAVALANLAAGMVVGRAGTGVISGGELRRAVDRENGADQRAVSEQQLLAALVDARLAGERIVFTNGCFDILHAGHVRCLTEARAMGDRLVVALNSDDSVRRLKGEGRPVNPLEQRMAVVAALGCVDWVVPFGDDTPIRLLEALKPDVLVKGGDYGLDQVVGAEVVRAYGGEVRTVPPVKGSSTTALIEAIKAQGPKQER